jgi:hypothetical protein
MDIVYIDKCRDKIKEQKKFLYSILAYISSFRALTYTKKIKFAQQLVYTSIPNEV